MLTGTNYGDFYSDVWAFNIPTRKWFNPQISMPTVYLDGHAGKLSETIYIVSSDSSSEKSSMRVWSLGELGKDLKPLVTRWNRRRKVW